MPRKAVSRNNEFINNLTYIHGRMCLEIQRLETINNSHEIRIKSRGEGWSHFYQTICNNSLKLIKKAVIITMVYSLNEIFTLT